MKCHTSATLQDILCLINERQILYKYFNISKIPCLINSPLRNDIHPSFTFYQSNQGRIYYKDFSTGEQGSLFDLLMQYYNLSFKDLVDKIYLDMNLRNVAINNKIKNVYKETLVMTETKLEVKTRDWKEYDMEYWNSYGCDIEYLKYAEVYPISHKIIIKNGKKYTFACDKLAYVFIERKENKITKKIYQPLNQKGYKWFSSNDKTVIGLWSKIPNKGDTLLICSSLKDSICLWCNIHIPCIYVQSETTGISDSAFNCLKERYRHIYIAFDGDEAGIKDSQELSKKTGLRVIDCPIGDKYKDWSDCYHVLGKDKMIEMFKERYNKVIDDLG